MLVKLGQSDDSVKLLTQLNYARPSTAEPLQHLAVIQAQRGELEQVRLYLYERLHVNVLTV